MNQQEQLRIMLGEAQDDAREAERERDAAERRLQEYARQQHVLAIRMEVLKELMGKGDWEGDFEYVEGEPDYLSIAQGLLAERARIAAGDVPNNRLTITGAVLGSLAANLREFVRETFLEAVREFEVFDELDDEEAWEPAQRFFSKHPLLVDSDSE